MKYERLARQIAYRAHRNQYRHDKITPYITHCEAVASNFKDDLRRSVALLHDVIEDSHYDSRDLLRMGISFEIVREVSILTRIKSEKYSDYIKNIKKSKIATDVKLADIAHNYKTSSESARERYDKAIKILREKNEANISILF
jgi:(p)ppGpp synthase/HD superfamily hydrolase